tara:strand:- start:54 stop:1625 length:1572 start_codon:yes stop_codon:yes gene_type:complete
MELRGNREKTVTTAAGNIVPREGVRRIKGEFYEVDKECFRIKSPKGELYWYRVASGKIGYVVEKNAWDLLSRILDSEERMIQGVYHEGPDLGYFPQKKDTTVFLYSKVGTKTPCYSEEVATSLGYIQSKNNSYFMHPNEFKLSEITRKAVYRYKELKINYGANEGSTTFVNINNKYGKAYKNIKVSDNTTELYKMLGNLTFGIEFETCNGVVPVRKLGALGLVPLKDGSLRDAEGREPYEYTTVPLQGPRGLETIKNITKELTEYCEVNEKCSLHVHLGGFERTEKMILALYMLSYTVQKEFLAMMPGYKIDPVRSIGSSKNYCQMLPDLGLRANNIFVDNDSNNVKERTRTFFNKIFSWTTDNKLSAMDANYNLTSYNHPSGAKWNQHARYHHINFVSPIFSRSGTLEFRLHPPTTNFTKTINWLMICASLIKFAQNNTDDIIKGKYDKITLSDLVAGYKNDFGNVPPSKRREEVATYLQNYIKFRIDLFKPSNKDILGKKSIEFEKDAAFTFKDKELDNLF